MITPAYCQKMARYNAWMNARLYRVCAGVDDAIRKADRGLFFGSIHTTLNHLLYGDIVWLSRFRQVEVEVPPPGAELHPEFESLWQARTAWDDEIFSWSASVDESWLRRDFSFTSKVDNLNRTHPAWVLVTHMFNHQTHHRGQLTAVLSQMGHDYGSTDIPFMPEKFQPVD
jgi:uncharacterized damage-inducible protein DinB